MMMVIAATTSLSRAMGGAQLSSAAGATTPLPVLAGPKGSLADRVGTLLASDNLGSAWGALMAPFSLGLGPADGPQGVSELSRGQSFQAGDKKIFTDANGNVDVDLDGRLEGTVGAVGGFVHGTEAAPAGLGAAPFGALGALLGGLLANSPCPRGSRNGNSLRLGRSGPALPAPQFGAVALTAQKTPSQKLSFKDGNIQLPNGKQIPFGNTGAIVVMPDGSQIAVGRQGNEQVRTAYGAPGQQIPVSPPGQTNVFYLNEVGDVVRQEVR